MSEQAVAEETNVSAKPDAEVDSAQDDLDSLLREYEEKTEPKVEPQANPDKIAKVLSYIEEQEARQAEQALNDAITNSVKTVKSGLDLGFEMPDKYIEGILHSIAAKDKRFLNAFQQRDSNPSGWEKALKAVSKDMQKDFAAVDHQATQDREAVTSAIRGAKQSTAQDETFDEKSVAKMSMDQLYKEFPELGR